MIEQVNLVSTRKTMPPISGVGNNFLVLSMLLDLPVLLVLALSFLSELACPWR